MNFRFSTCTALRGFRAWTPGKGSCCSAKNTSMWLMGLHWRPTGKFGILRLYQWSKWQSQHKPESKVGAHWPSLLIACKMAPYWWFTCYWMYHFSVFIGHSSFSMHEPIIPRGARQGPSQLRRTCSIFAYEDIKEVHKRRYLLQVGFSVLPQMQLCMIYPCHR